MACTVGPMARSITGTLKTESDMGKAPTRTVTARSIQANGKMDSSTEREKLCGVTVAATGENGETGMLMVPELNVDPTVPFDMMVSGSEIGRYARGIVNPQVVGTRCSSLSRSALDYEQERIRVLHNP